MSESESNSTSLCDFETAGQPTSITELDETAEDEIVTTFEEIDRWQTAVHVNGRDREFLVGREAEVGSKAFRVYEYPESDGHAGFAGVIAHDRTYGKTTIHRVGFNPAGESPTDETVVEPVTDLTVRRHDRTERLDEQLPAIRTDLTDSNWLNGRADAGYGEWIQAVNELADFVDDQVNTDSLHLPPNVVMQTKVMHGIARYPLEAESLLSQVSDSFRDNLDDGVYEASPEAFRTILLQYATDEVSLEG